MNRIEISGMLRKDGQEYVVGHLYWLDVARKSGTVDTLMVFSSDDLVDGNVHITGHIQAQYVRGMTGLPVFIVPDLVEYCAIDNLSCATVTGKLRTDPVSRKTKDLKSIATVVLNTEYGPVPVLLWGSNAKKAENVYHAGDTIKVEGRLQSRQYTDKKSNVRTTYELSSGMMELVSAKS